MKRVSTLLLLGVLAALLGALIIPALAQETPPGEGGIIVEGNFGGDVDNLNPIISSDTASTRIINLIFPGFLGVDPESQTIQPAIPGSLVTSWEVSEDNKVYTFHMRDDYTWNDGTPVTAADYMYTWNAIQSGVVETPLGFVTDIIASIEAPDDHTIVVTFAEADCTALPNASLPLVPSHIMPADFAELNDSDYNLNPTVTSGAFNFGEIRFGEQVSLIANQDYPDAEETGVSPTGFVYKNVPDQTVLVQQFLAGESNFIDTPPVNARADIRAAGDAGDVQVFTYPGQSWDYLALNFADPNNPQPALDESGNPIDQGVHPIFSDPKVRQAISLALDVDAMLEAAVFGEGERMASFSVPASWAYDQDLAPIGYDPEAAMALLDEAGWVDDDGDANTPRVASGALNAEDGTPLSFTLYTNEGNTRRGAIGTAVQDQLKQVGFDVDFQAIEFNTLLDLFDNQTFDAAILGWRNSYPDDPDQTSLFTTSGDTLPGGQNFTSYHNPQIDDLMLQARTVPGCATEDRAAIYHEIQAILQQDLPYIPLFVQGGMYAADSSVAGFGPYANNPLWNVDTWTLATP